MAITTSIRLLRQQNNLGAAPLDFVVSIVFVLHDCVCTSSLVLLSALSISHLRLLAFHQHCREHYNCIGAIIKFCLFPCKGSARLWQTCECLKFCVLYLRLYWIHCIQVQCRFPLSHVAQSETCLDQSHFLEADSIHFIHTPSIPPFPMQQEVPECCTESFLTLQFSLLGNNTRRMFLMSSQSPLL